MIFDELLHINIDQFQMVIIWQKIPIIQELINLMKNFNAFILASLAIIWLGLPEDRMYSVFNNLVGSWLHQEFIAVLIPRIIIKLIWLLETSM